MKTKKVIIILIQLAFALSVLANGTDETETEILFYLSCDDTLDAQVSKETLKPLKQEMKASYAQGKKGQGLKLWGSKRPYKYSSKKSLNITSGTIAFWLKVPEKLSKTWFGSIFQTGKKKDCNRIDIKLYPASKKKTMLYTYFYGKRLKPVSFVLSSWGQKAEKKWQPGDWVHVIVIWDELKGVAVFYNGQKVVGPPTNNGPFAIMSKSDSISLGPTTAIIDELYILNKPVSPAEFAKITKTDFKEPPVSVITYNYTK